MAPLNKLIFGILYKMSDTEYLKPEIVETRGKILSRGESFTKQTIEHVGEEVAKEINSQLIQSLVAPFVIPFLVTIGALTLLVLALFWFAPSWLAWTVLLLLLTPPLVLMWALFRILRGYV